MYPCRLTYTRYVFLLTCRHKRYINADLLTIYVYPCWLADTRGVSLLSCGHKRFILTDKTWVSLMNCWHFYFWFADTRGVSMLTYLDKMCIPSDLLTQKVYPCWLTYTWCVSLMTCWHKRYIPADLHFSNFSDLGIHCTGPSLPTWQNFWQHIQLSLSRVFLQKLILKYLFRACWDESGIRWDWSHFTSDVFRCTTLYTHPIFLPLFLTTNTVCWVGPCWCLLSGTPK